MLGFDGHVYDAVVREQPELTVCQVIREVVNVKLNYYGISGPILHWISVFLTNRTQTVVIDGKSSPTVLVTSGVPQGTVLNPVLFLAIVTKAMLKFIEDFVVF
jgi:hypothetical protein